MSAPPHVGKIPARILIVDDGPDNSEVLKIMLEWEGFTTQIAGSGEEALACVATKAPDLMVLDLGLPGLSGWDVTSQLKSNPATRDIPVIVISGRGDDATRLRVKNAGAADFILKPVGRADLSERVRNALSLKLGGNCRRPGHLP